jgi:hypothetical protein
MMDRPDQSMAADDIQGVDDLGLDCECIDEIRHEPALVQAISETLGRMGPKQRQTLRERLRYGLPTPFVHHADHSQEAYQPDSVLDERDSLGVYWAHPCDAWLRAVQDDVMRDIRDPQDFIPFTFASVLAVPPIAHLLTTDDQQFWSLFKTLYAR